MPKSRALRSLDTPYVRTASVAAYLSQGVASPGLTSTQVQDAIDLSLSAHEAEINPHPIYLTQAEGDAYYSLLGHNHDDRYYTETESDAKYALKTRLIGVSGLGLSGGGDLSADRTIALASSSNPGAAASVLATSASGALTLNNGGSTSQPALTIGDGTTGRMAIGSGGWLDDGTVLRTLGSRNFRVSTNTQTEILSDDIFMGGASGTTTDFRGGIVTGTAWNIDVDGSVLFADNTNTAHYLGMAKIGYVGHSNAAGFGHRASGATSYAFRQGASFSSYFNAGSGGWIYHRIADSDVMVMTADRLMPAGSAQKDLGDYNRKWRTIFAAELYVETLVAQSVMATIGGRVMVTPTTKLIADLSSAATTIDVEHNNLVGGEYIYMASAPSGLPRVEAMKITSSATAITGGYRYSVTRNLNDGGADNYVIGDAVVSLGNAVGEGYIDLTATSTIHNHLGPTMAIYQRTGTANWNDVAPTVAVGNLRSFVDYTGDTAGIAHGNNLTLSPTGGFSGVTSDNDNGVRLFNVDLSLYGGGTKLLTLDRAAGISLLTYDASGGVIGWGDQRIVSWAQNIGDAVPDGAIWTQRTTTKNEIYIEANQVGTRAGWIRMRARGETITGNAFDDAYFEIAGAESASTRSYAKITADDLTINLGNGSANIGNTTLYNAQLLLSDGSVNNDGSATAPVISFADDSDTGIYRSGANSINIATGGADRLTISSSSLLAEAPINIASGGECLKLTGTSTGDASTAYLAFYTSSGSRRGWVGDGNGANSDIYLVSDAGKLRFQDSIGNDALTINNGKVIVNGTSTSFQFKVVGNAWIDQSNSSLSETALAITQADLSEGFINFASTVGAGNPIDTAPVGTYYGKVRVAANGTFKYAALYNS